MRESVIYLSVSQRTAYKKCRWQWSWRYKRKLEPKTAHPALRFGKLAHTALEHLYPEGVKRGPHPAETFEKAYEAELRTQMKMGFRDDDGKWQEAGELGVAMMNGYVNLYGNDSEWKVLATEHEFEQPIYHNGEIIAYAIGVLDGVWQHRSTKEVIIADHKAVASIGTKHLLLDDQAGQYATFGVDYLIDKGFIKPDLVPTAIMFNFLRKQMPVPDEMRDEQGRKLNKDGSVSKQQPAPLFLRHKTYRGAAERDVIRRRVTLEAREIIAAKAGKVAILKTPSQFHCGTCPVTEICELHEIGQDWQAMARSVMKKRESRRESEIREAVEYEQSR
jgi:hypothetical protein